MLIFYGGRKTGEPGEKPSKQGRESTTNSTHMKYPSRGSNPRPIGATAVRGERITTTPPMLPLLGPTTFVLGVPRGKKTKYMALAHGLLYLHENKAFLPGDFVYGRVEWSGLCLEHRDRGVARTLINCNFEIFTSFKSFICWTYWS
jgi:hypothetical protein